MFVYMLLCADSSIYTGTARDLEKRMRDHFEKTPAAAAYTRAKGASYLLAAWECETYSGALRAEAAIKRLTDMEQRIMQMRYSQGFTDQEIAMRLGISSEDVRKSVNRARAYIKECVYLK